MSGPLDELENGMIDLEDFDAKMRDGKQRVDESIAKVIEYALSEWNILYPAYLRMRRVARGLSILADLQKSPLPETEKRQIDEFIALNSIPPRKPWSRRKVQDHAKT